MCNPSQTSYVSYKERYSISRCFVLFSFLFQVLRFTSLGVLDRNNYNHIRTDVDGTSRVNFPCRCVLFVAYTIRSLYWPFWRRSKWTNGIQDFGKGEPGDGLYLESRAWRTCPRLWERYMHMNCNPPPPPTLRELPCRGSGCYPTESLTTSRPI